MLLELHIRNFAVVSAVDIEFQTGMTIFTGETGAGKSIIVDAMGLILGDRADAAVVRSGQEKSEITARFQVEANSPVIRLLEEQEIDSEGDLYIRRVIGSDGRSKAFVNGSPSPIQFLKTLSEYLVDIHGQHAHQSLMRKGSQRDLLDDFANHAGLIKKVNDHYQLWIEIQRQLEQLSGQDDNRDAQLNLLKYQVEELQALQLEDGEYDQLQEDFKRLNNASKLLQSTQNVIDDMAEADHALLPTLHHHQQILSSLILDDDALKPLIELLDTAAIQLDEAVHEARHYLERVEINPERQNEIENRIAQLQETARKHHIKPEQLQEQFAKLNKQLADLEGGEARYQELTHLQSKARLAYLNAAEELHLSRQREAKKLDQAVMSKLQELGMTGGRFETQFSYDPEALPQKNGLDSIEFQVSANPGQPLRPIAKVASGGELSRISLAIQVINRRQQNTPSFVFDEVDAGIGGATADVVGRMLYSLVQQHQVFCVTHLPQVACYGDHHFHVTKLTSGETTQTEIIELQEEARVHEVARMLGGDITEKSLEHAKEILRNKKQESAA